MKSPRLAVLFTLFALSASAAQSPAGPVAASSTANLGVFPRQLAQGALEEHPTFDAPNRFSNFRFELHFDFGWYGAVGGGGRIEVPIAPRGLLTQVDDEIALSFGAEVFYFYEPSYAGIGVYPLASLQWNFFLASWFSIFPEVGVAFLFGPVRERYWPSFVAPYLGLGVRFHLNPRNAILVRGSWPAGLQVGITF